MFRVPTSSFAPSFDETFKVSFWRWLTSNKLERNAWRSLRHRAARFAEYNQNARVAEYVAGKHAVRYPNTTEGTPVRPTDPWEGRGL